MDNYNIPKKLPFSKQKLGTKVVLSYIFDYVIIMYVLEYRYDKDILTLS
jgi:hypothetical protein